MDTVMQGQAAPTLFVGRTRELRRLQTAFGAAMVGRGGLAFVAGEPGIGKTTLCRELATWATAQGALALVGQCDDAGELSVPYLPFVETLRLAVLALDPSDLTRDVGIDGADLARVVPDLQARLSDLPLSAAPADPAEARYRLLQAITGFFTRAAGTVPILLVLEDLQDADRGTLDLLAHLSRHMSDAPILIVGTYRDTEVDLAHPLAGTIASVRRWIAVDRLSLEGLTPAEVEELAGGIAGQAAPRGLGATLFAQTEGNPLFVWEVMRRRLDADRASWGTPLGGGITLWDLEGVPDGLAEVIGTRLGRLTPQCHQLLTIAAVIGREFALSTIRAIVDLPDETISDALGEAVRAAVLREQARVGEVRYRFAHALFRQSLYADLTAVDRMRLHPQVARVLEAQYSQRSDEHAGELAEHFSRSADADDLRAAIDYCRRAARHASTVYAPAEGARLLEYALAIQEVVAPDDLALRCDLLTDRGRALADAGEARRVLDEIAPRAYALAEGLDDAERASAVCQLAMASLQAVASSFALSSPEAAHWAARADRWAPEGSTARVWADTFLGALGFFRERWFDGIPLLTRALDLARRLGEPEAFWWAGWMFLGYAEGPRHTDEQLRLAEELAGRPRTGVSTYTLAMALTWMGAAFIGRGLRAPAEAAWQELTELAARSGQPRVHLIALRGPATLATIDGRLDEAAAIAEQMVRSGDESGLADYGRIGAVLSGQRALLHLGRYEEALAVSAPTSAAIRMLALAHLGRVAEVRAHLDQHVLARPAFGGDQDETQEYMDVFRLEAAVLVRHREAAARLVDRLARGRRVTTGLRAPTCIGRHLGAAAALLGRHEEALAHYQAALGLTQAMRFRPEAALIRLGLVELLVMAFPGRRAEAVEHLNVALSELRAMRMAPALARAERLAAVVSAPTPPVQHDRLTARETEVLRLVAAGKSNAEIADVLVVSIRTAERHLANIYSKLGTGGPVARATATAYAHTHGLVQSSRD